MGHRHRPQPHHHHGSGGHPHAGLRFGPGVAPVHRIGRRRFLTELGRNTFAIALLGGAAAACSSDDDATPDPASEPENAAPTESSAAATSTVAAGAPPTAAPDDAPATTDAESAPEETSLRWAQANLGFVSAYVLVRGNEAAVVDTGSSGSADQIGEALATLGATYDDVRHVVLTHHHPDHIGSLPVVLKRVADGATAYAGEADIPSITTTAELVAVGDGDDVFGLQVVHTPGHTPGSISLFDPGIGLLVAGDALNGDETGTGLSGADERFTADMATADDSVVKLAELDADAVAMGHGQPVAAGAGPLLEALAAGL